MWHRDLLRPKCEYYVCWLCHSNEMWTPPLKTRRSSKLSSNFSCISIRNCLRFFFYYNLSSRPGCNSNASLEVSGFTDMRLWWNIWSLKKMFLAPPSLLILVVAQFHFPCTDSRPLCTFLCHVKIFIAVGELLRNSLTNPRCTVAYSNKKYLSFSSEWYLCIVYWYCVLLKIKKKS